MRSFKDFPVRIGVILAGCALVFIFSFLRVFSLPEYLTYDLRLKLRPSLKQSPSCVIIEISDDTLKNLGKWPLPRDFHASLIDVLKASGAKSIVFDLLFSEPTVYDETLAGSVKDAGNVFMGIAFEDILGRRFPAYSERILADIRDIFKEKLKGSGFVNVFVESDGKARRVPLVARHKDRLYPQLGFAAACDFLGLNAGRIEHKGGYLTVDGRLKIPVLPDGSFPVNYPAPWAGSFLHLSFFEILKSFNDSAQGLKPDLDLSVLKDKVCFVGLTATGTSDIRPNPLESLYPMLGAQASVFNSIVTRRFITDAGAGVNTLINLALFLLVLFFCLNFTPLRSFAASLASAAIYFLAALLTFIFFGYWMDLFLPVTVVIFTYASCTAYRFFAELKKRQLLEKELDIAAKIQESFLPEGIKESGGFFVSSFMLPAKFVAGDLFDNIALEGGRLGVVIADVSGKGVSASLIMAQTISLFRVFARQHKGCAEVMNRLNKELYGKLAGRFITCLYVVLEPEAGLIRACSAGHGPLLIWRKDLRKVEEAELSAGLPLGVTEEAEYQEVEIKLNRKDRAVFFTDGLTEARNAYGEEFGVEAVKKVISENASLDADGLMRALKNAESGFAAKAFQHDDLTVIVIANERKP